MICLLGKGLIPESERFRMLNTDTSVYITDVCGICPRTDKMMRQVVMHLVNPERFASFMECLQAHMHMPAVRKSMETMLMI